MRELLVAGGDRRMLCLARLLRKNGYEVQTMGLMENESAGKADAVLFPYPFSQKDGFVPVLTGENFRPEDALARAKQGAAVLTGKGMAAQDWHESYRVKRYTDACGFEKRNAELSAEAAVCECMMRGPVAMMDAKALVTGYGLFGRALALKLKALGADVRIAARREQQREMAEREGFKSVSIVEIAEALPDADLVLNTVPARILSEYHLKMLKKDCLLLELASAPYGYDAETAGRLGIKHFVLPGLPGRYSPMSAAMALYEAAEDLLGRVEA